MALIKWLFLKIQPRQIISLGIEKAYTEREYKLKNYVHLLT